MKSREQEYRELFMAEALEAYDSMSQHLSVLEKRPDDEASLNELFRMMHNLKANARAMEFADIGEVAHRMETIFGQIRSKERAFSGSVVPVVFTGVDALGNMIRAVGANQARPNVEPLLDNLERLINGEEPVLETDAAALSDEEANRKLELSDLVYIQIKKLDHLLNLVAERCRPPRAPGRRPAVFGYGCPSGRRWNVVQQVSAGSTRRGQHRAQASRAEHRWAGYSD
jgi:two-component system chemotaxis sensor kinase CheA